MCYAVTQPIVEGFMTKARADPDLKQIVVVRPSLSLPEKIP
jgi:hypothetical protein